MTRFTPFDAADYLTDEETIAAYLSAAREDPDPEMFLRAVETVARARGMCAAGGEQPPVAATQG